MDIYPCMRDTNICPICGDKMRSIRETKFYQFLKKKASFVERTCNGTNHSIQLLTDESTQEVDLLKISLSPDYSRFIFIDFYNQKCELLLMKDTKKQSINIPKMIIPDFPDLVKLKERISVYITFS